MGTRLLLAVILLLLRTPGAEALMEPQLCYVLDAILFLYGIVVTVLYCRLKMLARREGPGKEKEEAVYAGLSAEAQETYETLRRKEP